MKSLVCQAQHLELNPLLYGQPMKLAKDWGDMFISPSIGYFHSGSVLCSTCHQLHTKIEDIVHFFLYFLHKTGDVIFMSH